MKTPRTLQDCGLNGPISITGEYHHERIRALAKKNKRELISSIIGGICGGLFMLLLCFI